MEILIIAALIIAAIVFLILELFLIPGISIAGILAAASSIFAIYYAFANIGATGGIVTIIVLAICTTFVLYYFIHSKAIDKISLQKSINSKVDKNKHIHISIGEQGVTKTRLAQIGMADFNGNVVEVKSEDGLLNENTPIIVSSIEEGVIKVKRI